MKKGSSLVLFITVILIGILFLWARSLHHEIKGLHQQIQNEEQVRTEKDDLILKHVDDSLENVMVRMESMEKSMKKLSKAQDMEAALPNDYVQAVRALMTEQIAALINQPPVFGPAWEILSIRFIGANLVAIECKDGEISASLLVLIYPEENEDYSSEVLYADVKS